MGCSQSKATTDVVTNEKGITVDATPIITDTNNSVKNSLESKKAIEPISIAVESKGSQVIESIKTSDTVAQTTPHTSQDNRDETNNNNDNINTTLNSSSHRAPSSKLVGEGENAVRLSNRSNVDIASFQRIREAMLKKLPEGEEELEEQQITSKTAAMDGIQEEEGTVSDDEKELEDNLKQDRKSKKLIPQPSVVMSTSEDSIPHPGAAAANLIEQSVISPSSLSENSAAIVESVDSTVSPSLSPSNNTIETEQQVISSKGQIQNGDAVDDDNGDEDVDNESIPSPGAVNKRSSYVESLQKWVSSPDVEDLLVASDKSDVIPSQKVPDVHAHLAASDVITSNAAKPAAVLTEGNNKVKITRTANAHMIELVEITQVEDDDDDDDEDENGGVAQKSIIEENVQEEKLGSEESDGDDEEQEDDERIPSPGAVNKRGSYVESLQKWVSSPDVKDLLVASDKSDVIPSTKNAPTIISDVSSPSLVSNKQDAIIENISQSIANIETTIAYSIQGISATQSGAAEDDVDDEEEDDEGYDDDERIPSPGAVNKRGSYVESLQKWVSSPDVKELMPAIDKSVVKSVDMPAMTTSLQPINTSKVQDTVVEIHATPPVVIKRIANSHMVQDVVVTQVEDEIEVAEDEKEDYDEDDDEIIPSPGAVNKRSSYVESLQKWVSSPDVKDLLVASDKSDVIPSSKNKPSASDASSSSPVSNKQDVTIESISQSIVNIETISAHSLQDISTNQIENAAENDTDDDYDYDDGGGEDDEERIPIPGAVNKRGSYVESLQKWVSSPDVKDLLVASDKSDVNPSNKVSPPQQAPAADSVNQNVVSTVTRTANAHKIEDVVITEVEDSDEDESIPVPGAVNKRRSYVESLQKWVSSPDVNDLRSDNKEIYDDEEDDEDYDEDERIPSPGAVNKRGSYVESLQKWASSPDVKELLPASSNKSADVIP